MQLQQVRLLAKVRWSRREASHVEKQGTGRPVDLGSLQELSERQTFVNMLFSH